MAFGHVAGLKVEVDKRPVIRDSDLAKRAFFHAREAHDRILGSGRKARSAKASKAALKRADVLYGADKSLVQKLLRNREGSWTTKSDAIKWIDAYLTQTGESALAYGSRLETLRRWWDSDCAFQEAYEEGLRLAK
jgi:hypothetical protein